MGKNIVFAAAAATVVAGHVRGSEEPRTYVLSTSLKGETFFDNFDFYTSDDPTHGYVDFVGYEEAKTLKMVSYDNSTGLVYMGSDYSEIPSDSSRGRKSIRVESRYSTDGNVLIIIDLKHMPTSSGYLADGCGIWPAFWTVGSDWPNNGEIDIIEYANSQSSVLTTLHTTDGCDQSHEETSAFTGAWANGLYGNPTDDCYIYAADQWVNQGCGIYDAGQSCNSQFNSKDGGVFALEWVADSEIRAFYFQRTSIPSDILSKAPKPSLWGAPYARFEIGSESFCSSDHFKAHRIIFDLTFCGDWAGSTFGDQCQTSESCESYVRHNPSFFTNSYWLIDYVDIYDIVVN